MDISKLSANRLNAEATKRGDKQGAIGKAMIAAGRGLETFRETRAKADSDPSDKLAIAYCAAFDIAHEAYTELAARRRYHGTDKPIKRREW